jgi:hypothetical protein
MVIEKSVSEIIIRLPADFDTTYLQEFLDYLNYKQIISKSEASQEDIDDLANESKTSWWEANKQRFVQ